MKEQELQRILASCDHTLLAVDATWEQIRGICEDAVRYGTASVCIPPSYAERAAAYLKEACRVQGVCREIPVCTVIGFPNGYCTPAVKAFEARQAIREGASEVDMVINIGWVKDGRYDLVLDEIHQVRAASEGFILKVIIETCLLTKEEKIRMCEVVTQSGADFIKTSTGFSTGGATFADVVLMKEHVGPDVRIKAAGGIASLEDAQRFLDLGASRLGTSRVVRIVKAMENR